MCVDLGYVDEGLEAQLREVDYEIAVERLLDHLHGVVAEVLAQGNTAPDLVYLTGGMAKSPVVRTFLPPRLERGRACWKLQAFEDLPRHRGIFDGRDEAQRGPAARAPQSVDLEDALKQRSPSHPVGSVSRVVGGPCVVSAVLFSVRPDGEPRLPPPRARVGPARDRRSWGNPESRFGRFLGEEARERVSAGEEARRATGPYLHRDHEPPSPAAS